MKPELIPLNCPRVAWIDERLISYEIGKPWEEVFISIGLWITNGDCSWKMYTESPSQEQFYRVMAADFYASWMLTSHELATYPPPSNATGEEVILHKQAIVKATLAAQFWFNETHKPISENHSTATPRFKRCKPISKR
jgi:hypothetical protein